MEEERGDTFNQETLKETFIEYFSFVPVEKCLKEAVEELEQFNKPLEK